MPESVEEIFNVHVCQDDPCPKLDAELAEKLEAGVTTHYTKIEEAYPEAYKLAREFHELYEKTAPGFGYATREETKEFDPSSPNGRLMAYVCKMMYDDVYEEAYAQGRASMREEILAFKMHMNDKPWCCIECYDSKLLGKIGGIE